MPKFRTDSRSRTRDEMRQFANGTLPDLDEHPTGVQQIGEQG